MAMLAHLAAELADVTLLTEDGGPGRSPHPYLDAYAAHSPPVRLPLPAGPTSDGPDSPLRCSDAAAQPKRAGGGSGGGGTAPSPEPQPTRLPRFAGVDARAPPGQPAQPAGVQTDVLLNAGGPAWALDWLPTPPDQQGQEAASQYLAVGAHPKRREATSLGKPMAGPAMLQLWRLQHRPSDGQAAAAPPALVLGICHDGGLVRDAKWCPTAGGSLPASSPASLPRLGLLAVLLGDGTLQLLAIPEPGALAARLQRPADQPLLLRLAPKLAAAPDAMDSLGSCVEWLPVPPHDLLAMGCWDGTAALWRLPPAGERHLQLLAHFIADSGPLRSVAWLPPPQPGCAQDTHARRIFATGSHTSSVRFWDVQDPFVPVLEERCFGSWILALTWAGSPSGLLVCQDDGALRWIALTPGGNRRPDQISNSVWWGVTSGSLWSCDLSSVSGHAAYGGDSGQVAVAPPRFQQAIRKRCPHFVASSTRLQDGVVCMAVGGPREPVGNRQTGAQPRLPDPAACVLRVRWGAAAATQPQATWLASAGATGLVRCQRIAVD